MTICKVIGLIHIVIGTMALATNIATPFVADFVSFWAAAVLGFGDDPAAVYDVAAHKAVQGQVNAPHGLLPFFYPPPLLIILLPLGLLPYWTAAVAWTAGTFVLYVAAARRLLPGAGWLAAAMPAVVVNAIIGQIGFLTAALFVAGSLSLPKRPFVGGLLFGCLIVKPHLAILLPLAFLAAGQWRAIAGAALSASGLLALALLTFGPGMYEAWLGQAPVYASILRDGLVPWHKMASVYAALRHAGVAIEPAVGLHVVVALVAALAVWRVWRRSADPAATGAVLAAASVLVSPYLFLYDTLILVMAFAWLLTVERRRWLIAGLWCVPFLGVAQNWILSAAPNLTPVVSIAVLALAYRHAMHAAPVAIRGRDFDIQVDDVEIEDYRRLRECSASFKGLQRLVRANRYLDANVRNP